MEYSYRTYGHFPIVFAYSYLDYTYCIFNSQTEDYTTKITNASPGGLGPMNKGSVLGR